MRHACATPHDERALILCGYMRCRHARRHPGHLQDDAARQASDDVQRDAQQGDPAGLQEVHERRECPWPAPYRAPADASGGVTFPGASRRPCASPLHVRSCLEAEQPVLPGSHPAVASFSLIALCDAAVSPPCCCQTQPPLQRVSPVTVSAHSSKQCQRLRAGNATAISLPRVMAAMASAEIAWRVQPAVRHSPCQGSGRDFSGMPGKSSAITGDPSHSFHWAHRARFSAVGHGRAEGGRVEPVTPSRPCSCAHPADCTSC